MDGILWLIAFHLVTSSNPTPTVSLAKVQPLDYPQAARMLGVAGDVIVHVQVRPDGIVASAHVDVGLPVLEQGALDNARQATFVCRGCSDPVTPYTLSYTFRLTPNPDCLDCVSQQPTLVTFTGNHVAVSATLACIMLCDPVLVRSPRCLWLWRCGVSDGCQKWEEQRKKQCEAMCLPPLS